MDNKPNFATPIDPATAEGKVSLIELGPTTPMNIRVYIPSVGKGYLLGRKDENTYWVRLDNGNRVQARRQQLVWVISKQPDDTDQLPTI